MFAKQNGVIKCTKLVWTVRPPSNFWQMLTLTLFRIWPVDGQRALPVDRFQRESVTIVAWLAARYYAISTRTPHRQARG